MNGLVPVIPSSVSVGSGTGSVSATGKITFSGATYVDVNDVFTSSYRDYQIMGYYKQSSGNTNLRMYALNAGTPETATTWDMHELYIDGTSRTSADVVDQSYGFLGYAGSSASLNSGIAAWITEPQTAAASQINVFCASNYTDASIWIIHSYRPSLSFTGARIQLNGTITISGTFMIYGLGE